MPSSSSGGPSSWPGGRRPSRAIAPGSTASGSVCSNRPITAAERADAAAFLAEIRNLDAGRRPRIPRASRLGGVVSCLARLQRIPRASVTIEPTIDHHSSLAEIRHDQPLLRSRVAAAIAGNCCVSPRAASALVALQGMMSGLARAAGSPLAARAPHFAPRAGA